MKAPLFYRIASVLLVLFAVGHTLGFRQNNPQWKADAVLASMQSVHFDALGFNRTYWDFFSGFGFFCSVFLLSAGVMSWQLSRIPAETLARIRGIPWTLAICFLAITALSCRFAFTMPTVFSTFLSAELLKSLDPIQHHPVRGNNSTDCAACFSLIAGPQVVQRIAVLAGGKAHSNR